MKASVLCGLMRRNRVFLIVAAVVIAAVGFGGCDLIFDMSPAKPSFTSHEITGSDEGFPRIKLYWEWADDADQHVLERKALDEGTGFIEVTWDYISAYEDHGSNLPENKLKAGNTYVYRVRGYSDEMPTEFGPWSEEYTVRVPPFLPPNNVSAGLSTSDDLIRVEWDRVEVDEVSYEVWRSEQLDGYYSSLDTCDICMYEDTYLDVGTTYYYKVVALHPRWGRTAESDPAVAEGPAMPAPVMHDASIEDEPLVVRWSPVQGAWGYRVYRAESNPGSDSSYTMLQSSYIQPSTGSEIHEDGEYVCFSDTTAQPGVTYYYKVQCCDADYAESSLSASYVSGYTGTAGVTGSWADLGSAGFGTVASGNEPVLAADGGDVYLFYPDGGDGRLKAMSTTGDGEWSEVGGYLSDGTVESGHVSALVTGDNVYAAYPYDDLQGGDPMIYVRQWTGSDWESVGSTESVSWWNDQASQEAGAWGDEPSIAMAGSNIFLVYTGDSLNIVESLTYDGGDFWAESDNGYWFDNTISSFGQILRTDSTGGVISALEQADTVEFYRYGAGAWSSYAGQFAPGGETASLSLWDFLLDGDDTPYALYETLDSGGSQLVCTVIAWTGSSWIDTGLATEISAGGRIMDAAIVEHPDGNGFYVATVYRDEETTDATYFVDLHAYDGSSWSRAAPQIEPAAGVNSIDLALDSSGRPVVVYAEGSSGVLHAKGFRP